MAEEHYKKLTFIIFLIEFNTGSIWKSFLPLLLK